MKLFKFIAILFFDLLDKFFHQRRILGILKKKINEIDVFLDIGAHKGTYTDLVINNFKAKKVLMFEPQEDIFNYLKKNMKTKIISLLLIKHSLTKAIYLILILTNMI